MKRNIIICDNSGIDIMSIKTPSSRLNSTSPTTPDHHPKTHKTPRLPPLPL